MYCKKCNAQISEGSNYCNYCGTFILENPEQVPQGNFSAPQPTKKERFFQNPKKRKLIIICAAVLVALAFIDSIGDETDTTTEATTSISNTIDTTKPEPTTKAIEKIGTTFSALPFSNRIF